MPSKLEKAVIVMIKTSSINDLIRTFTNPDFDPERILDDQGNTALHHLYNRAVNDKFRSQQLIQFMLSVIQSEKINGNLRPNHEGLTVEHLMFERVRRTLEDPKNCVIQDSLKENYTLLQTDLFITHVFPKKDANNERDRSWVSEYRATRVFNCAVVIAQFSCPVGGTFFRVWHFSHAHQLEMVGLASFNKTTLTKNAKKAGVSKEILEKAALGSYSSVEKHFRDVFRLEPGQQVIHVTLVIHHDHPLRSKLVDRLKPRRVLTYPTHLCERGYPVATDVSIQLPFYAPNAGETPTVRISAIRNGQQLTLTEQKLIDSQYSLQFFGASASAATTTCLVRDGMPSEDFSPGENVIINNHTNKMLEGRTGVVIRVRGKRIEVLVGSTDGQEEKHVFNPKNLKRCEPVIPEINGSIQP
jgi:hypothetical protein